MDEHQEKQLIALTQADTWYQNLLQRCEAAEECYQQILEKLSEEDREAVERYITLCEELEYRRTCLAVTRLN